MQDHDDSGDPKNAERWWDILTANRDTGTITAPEFTAAFCSLLDAEEAEGTSLQMRCDAFVEAAATAREKLGLSLIHI